MTLNTDTDTYTVTFHYSLTQELSRRLELQQKKALAIILRSNYRSYSNALELAALPRLDTLRQEACLQWALKAQSNPKHSDLFHSIGEMHILEIGRCLLNIFATVSNNIIVLFQI